MSRCENRKPLSRRAEIAVVEVLVFVLVLGIVLVAGIEKMRELKQQASAPQLLEHPYVFLEANGVLALQQKANVLAARGYRIVSTVNNNGWAILIMSRPGSLETTSVEVERKGP